MKKYTSLFVFLVTLCMQGQNLVHYWNFNSANLEDALKPTVTLSGNPGSISYVLGVAGQTPGIETATNAAFTSDNRNARNGDAALQHLRVNNNVGSVITINLPTVGFEKPILRVIYARTTQGGRSRVIDYSTNGVDFIKFDSVNSTSTDINLYSFDFSSITEANDNPNFKVRIRIYAGGGAETNASGNYRFDNLTLDATPLGGGDQIAPVAKLSPLNNTYNVSLDVAPKISFNEKIKLVNGKTFQDAIIFKRGNENGANVDFTASFVNDSSIVITPTNLLSYGSVYYLELNPNTIEDLAGNVVTAKNASTFRTVSETSFLAPGSLVPVAIQTNTTSTGVLSYDRVALLFLTDVSSGTAINITDAKFTSNVGQCAGGFTWFAPEGGIKAGEVVTFITENAALSANTGSVTGSGYGLSSGGEQVFFYMGSNTNPDYITAISTNAWLADGTTHTNCGGSNSLRPSALNVDNSISLATAPGNNNGIVVNAYYNGVFDLSSNTVEQIRTAVLNPANWITAPSGPAQTWTNWSLGGPTKVVSAQLVSSNSLRIVFNKDLDATSAGNLSNYTGVANLTSASVSNNGTLADTIVLNFSTGFADGVENTLVISGVTSATGASMIEPYTFKFTYIAASKVSFAQNLRIMTEGGSTTLTLNLDKTASGKARLTLKSAPFSTAVGTDHNFSTQDIEFLNENTKPITINAIDDALLENDEYFVIELEAVENLEVQGFQYATVYIKDNDKKAPVATKEIELELVTSFDPSPTGSTTEAIAYDPTTKRLYATSAVQNRFDIVDFSNPASPVTIKSVSLERYSGGITGIAVRNGLVVVGAPSTDQFQTGPGKLVFFNSDGDSITAVQVGSLPDMVTFTPDGKKVLCANEGQPNNAYDVDPEGSVSVVDVSGGPSSINQSKTKTISFQPFNALEATLIANGVRKTFKNSTLSQDLEPEYITFSDDSKRAWVVCQENNAMVEIDLEKDTLVSIWGLGIKDYSLFGNGADMAAAGPVQNNVLIANWPVKGYYQPDAIKTYTVNGKTYIVTTNEGDEKEYAGLNERTTVGNAAVILDPVKFPHAAVLKQNYTIGGFRISNIKEYADPDNDGDYDSLLAVGARSFSIFDVDTKQLVYDSGDDFDYITSQDPIYAPLFNSSHDNNTLKSRSITKGAEPEALDIAEIDGKKFAFIGLERIGGVMVYNITDPTNPVFVDYKNNRSLTSNSGDLGPEYVIYLGPDKSPDGKYYVLVANEISGTITVFGLKGSILSENDAKVKTNAPFYIYPNPAKSKVTFSDYRDVEVMDMTGVLKYKGFTSEISLENFTQGVYILKTNQGEIRKLVVE